MTDTKFKNKKRRSEREKRITVRGDFKTISNIKMAKEQYGIDSIVDFIINKKDTIGFNMEIDLEHLIDLIEWIIDNQDLDLAEAKLKQEEMENVKKSIVILENSYVRNSNSEKVKMINAAIQREDIEQCKKTIFQITTTPENKKIYDKLKGEKTNLDFIFESMMAWKNNIVKPTQKTTEKITEYIKNHEALKSNFKEWNNEIRSEALELMEVNGGSFKNASLKLMEDNNIEKYKTVVKQILELKINVIKVSELILKAGSKNENKTEINTNTIEAIPVEDTELPELDEIEEVDLDDLELNENEEEEQPNPFDEIFGEDE